MMFAHICESYGREYDVKFNTQKTHLVVCDYLNKYINMSSLTLNGETIIRQRIASHLGHVVGVDSHNITIRHAVNDLTWRTNYMLSKFASCNSQVKTRFFRTFCTNYYLAPHRGRARYCNAHVCLFVCVFVCLCVCLFVCPCFRKISKCNISAISQPIIIKLGIHITYGYTVTEF